MSGFYHWQNRAPSARTMRNEHLKNRIFELFSEHNGMAGSPMITADLHDDPEFYNVGQNRVARLMRDMNLKCKTLKKFVVTTDSKHSEPVAPIGDSYTIRVNYMDVTFDEFSHTIEHINSTFVYVTTPADGETVTTMTPSISWPDTPGISEYRVEIRKTNYDIIWFYRISTGGTHVLYNLDGNAEEMLQFGATYWIFLISKDGFDNNTMTRSTFTVE